ncbi:MAG: zf-HC2 domain-containing protein [Pseudomonadota bacterium]
MKSTCPDSLQISAFMDAELPELRMEAFRWHLTECNHCREQLAKLQKTDQLIHDMPEIEPSRQFEINFWKKVSAMEKQRRKWSFFTFFPFRYKPLAAAILSAMILVGLALWKNQPPSSIEMDEIVIAENLEMLQNFQEIDHLELLENLETIINMDERS